MSGSGRGQPVSLGVGVASWCVWGGRGQLVCLGWAWPAGVSGSGRGQLVCLGWAWPASRSGVGVASRRVWGGRGLSWYVCPGAPQKSAAFEQPSEGDCRCVSTGSAHGTDTSKR